MSHSQWLVRKVLNGDGILYFCVCGEQNENRKKILVTHAVQKSGSLRNGGRASSSYKHDQ
jgi:hypothetical protein